MNIRLPKYTCRLVSTCMLTFSLLFSVIPEGLSQFYEYGQDAGSLRWNQFKTPHYRIIYPRGVDSVARAFAHKLEYFYPYQGEVLDHDHSNMPVIIHNESSFSNGVFVWAPKRLEIFTNPDPNSYPSDWLTELALHEGRHAFQIDKLDQGITKALSYLGGEQVVGAMAGFLPYWYLEGDAVDAETRFSYTGRGRQPEFEMELKAQMTGEERIYSYSKATLGSYKDYIPNHYRLGYLMVRYGRIMHGDRIWIDFQNYAARKPFLLTPTNFALRQNGIRSKNSLYKDALNYYKNHWDSMGTWRLVTDYYQWNRDPKKFHTSYSFPQFISASLAVAVKEGIDQIPEFILLGRKGEEKRIHIPGYLNSGRVSASGDLVVWDEFVPDERWSNRNYSVIKTLHIGSGLVRTISRKSRYYAPSISKDAGRIAVIEHREDYRFSLVILDVNGEILQSVPSPNNFFIQHPSWMEKDSAIVMTLTGDHGKSLVKYSPATGRWEQLFQSGFDDINYPVVHGTRIFFGGTFSGIDNIYCLDLGEDRVYQVTSSKYGGFQPQVSYDGKTLILADYGPDGYSIKSIELVKDNWKPLKSVADHTEQISYESTEKENQILRGQIYTDATRYNVKPYRKVFHAFKFHSWLPLYFDYLNPGLSFNVEDLPVSPGITLLSQNLLTTVISQFGYEYRDGYHYLHSGIQMKGRYPVLNLSTHYGGLPGVLNPVQGDTVALKPNNFELKAETFIPFRLNTGSFLTFVQPRVSYSYSRDYQYYEDKNQYIQGAHYLLYDLYATSYLRMGKRDILPRIGFTASANYAHSPANSQLYGSEVIGRFSTYLPGILRHQTIKATVNYYRQYPLSRTRPSFRYLIAPPRGMESVYGLDMIKLSVDYVFPILYPDLNIEGFFYLKRIRGALFADYLTGKDVIILEPRAHYEDRAYKSFGLELLADFHLMRITFPISMGGRMAYIPETQKFAFEWIYSVSID